MKIYTTDQLKEILKLHQLWLQSEEKGTCADLSWANLREADLSLANFSWANLRGADLSVANLSGANLSVANLRCADLRGANLRLANLSCANLRGADLSVANLSCANLRRADLRRANLSGANLRGADLSWADLRGAIGLPIADDAPSRLLAVAKSALSSSDALEMGTWHTCETTHCVCGWAEHLGGSLAKLIVEQFGNDVGGLMLLGVKAHSYFYSTNGQARAFLQSVIDNAEVRE
jgi:hypothetical protein